VETARPGPNKVDSQITELRDSLSMRKQSRVYRKLSLEPKIEGGKISPEKYVRLPKLLNKGIFAM
jgi:hypothetical protein